MGRLLFFVFAVAAGLLWAAACTAGAARVGRGARRVLLGAVGAGVPVLAVLPVVAAAWHLAFGARVPVRWFPQACTLLAVILLGGAWIVRSGLVPRAGGHVPATRWPLVGLAALCTIATAVTAGVLLILDNAVAAEAPYLRLEAARIVQAIRPPDAADPDDAAPLHLQAGGSLAADPLFDADAWPVAEAGDAPRDEVTAILARHSATLALIREAADRDACRFIRDRAAASPDTWIPGFHGLRGEARLLALAARRTAAEGRHGDALADIVRIRRLGRHAASEPLLVSYLAGDALERVALAELADLLPRLRAEDAPLLDSPVVRELTHTPLSLVPALRGEEAFGLATFAGFADGRTPFGDALRSDRADGLSAVSYPGPIYRVWVLPGDIDGYRRLMHRVQRLAARREERPDEPEWVRDAEGVEESLLDDPPGLLPRMMGPALATAFRARARSEAVHRAAAVLVDATRQRLATGALPPGPASGRAASIVPPADPLAPGGPPMVVRPGDACFSVYSVGPDGVDDGGPSPPWAAGPEAHDDVGLVMGRHASK